MNTDQSTMMRSLRFLSVFICVHLWLLFFGVTRAEKHEFIYDVSNESTKPQSVHVAGDFNGWSKDANPMHPDGNAFKATVDLVEGVHYYKFVVNGDKWVTDPQHSDKELEVDDN